MPEPKTKIVKIQRGRYSPGFQVARAWLSAASALAPTRPAAAISYIEGAISELQALRTRMVEDSR